MASASVFKASSRDEPAIELDNLRNPLALNVDVLSGVHAGVAQRMEGREVTIGSGGDCDLILFADPIAGRHVSIEPKSSIGSTVIVKALDGRVVLDSGTTLEPGQWAEGRMPLDLSIEGTHVTISRTINPHEFTKPALAVAAALGLIVAGPTIVNSAFSSVTRAGDDYRVVADVRERSPSYSPSMLRTTAAPAPSLTAENDVVTNATSMSGLEDVLIGFRSRVRDAGLGHLVEISEGRDGTILASGEIGAESASGWRSVLRWYDSVPRAPGLVNAVRLGKSPELPAIASVWLVGDPQITLSTGQKLREGDRARGGWTVKSIGETGVVLTRNGADVTVAF